MGDTVPTESELDDLLKRTFTSNFRRNYIKVDGFVLPERFTIFQERINNFPVFDTDVWICGFPKTGTTWVSEIAWLIGNDFDYEGAKEYDHLRTSVLEFSALFDTGSTLDVVNFLEDSVSYTNNKKHPRHIKTHLPFSLIPEQIRNDTRKPKVIYMARNPMDVCISYYHQCKNYEGFVGTSDEFYQLFLFDKINFGPYADHVLSFLPERIRPNFLILTYEEMKKDIVGVIDKVAQLLEKTVTNTEKQKLIQHVSFESMKNNPAVNKQDFREDCIKYTGQPPTPFIRQGEVGGYKRTMPPKFAAQLETKMKIKFQASGINLLDV